MSNSAKATAQPSTATPDPLKTAGFGQPLFSIPSKPYTFKDGRKIIANVTVPLLNTPYSALGAIVEAADGSYIEAGFKTGMGASFGLPAPSDYDRYKVHIAAMTSIAASYIAWEQQGKNRDTAQQATLPVGRLVRPERKTAQEAAGATQG